MPTEIGRLGIFAGEGGIALQLYRHCIAHHIPVSVIMFDGCRYDEWPRDVSPVLHTPIEKVGAIFSFLKKTNVTDVIMIGNLARPSIKSLRPDWRGIKALGKIAGAFMQGDDGLLRSLRREIEAEGYRVRGADYFLKDLTAPVGTLTKTAPNDAEMTRITIGIDAAIAHGLADKGQCVLVHAGGSISYEQQDGTSALIMRDGRAGAILVKTVKPQQDLDLDRPTVGVNTIEALHATGCAGLVIQANSVFMVDKDAMIAAADAHGIFIVARDVTP